MARKRDSPKLIKIKDAINLINQQVSLIGIVLEQREPKQCRNNGNPNPQISSSSFFFPTNFRVFVNQIQRILLESIIYCCHLSIIESKWICLVKTLKVFTFVWD